MCIVVALIVFIIALILGVSWATDLASGLAGLFGVVAVVFFVGALIFLVVCFIGYITNKDKE